MTKPALIDLVNAALVKIGQDPIITLDNNEAISPTVTMVRSTVDITKREILRINDWNCARKTIKLTKLANHTNSGWEYAYQLPTNPECLRVVQISVDDGDTYIDLDEYYNHNKGLVEHLFDIDGSTLLSNTDNIWIKYTADIDAANFDATLASAFVAQLAADLAYALPASVSLADYLTKIARQKLKAARSANARERNRLRPEGDVIGIRYGYGEKQLRVDMSDELGE